MPRYRFEELVNNITEKGMPAPGDEKWYIGLEHLDSGSLSVTRWGGDVELTGQKLVMKKGDILFGRRNTYLRRVAIAPHDGYFSAHGMIFRAREEHILPEYLPFFIASDYFMDAAIRISVGSLSPTVNWKTLKELEFEIPEIEEQRKSAALLWAVENTKRAYEELLKQSDELVKSQFIELFGDPQKNSYHWPKVKLKDCLVRIDSGKSITCETFSRTGYLPAVLKLSAVTYGEYNANENKQLPDPDLFVPEAEVKAGDLLFSRKNTLEYVGMSALVKDTPPNLMLPDLIFRLVPRKNICPQYLHQLINHSQYRSTISNLATGTAGSMPNISKQKLLELEIPLPPIEDQRRIEPIVEQLDKSKYLIPAHSVHGRKRR